MIKWLINKIFGIKINDLKIFGVLGKKVYISNGVGYGVIRNEYLYNGGLLEIGFGRTVSGRGDWGGGFTRASTCPLSITIDRDYIIHKMETDSFYNSESSKITEKDAIKLMKQLKEGDILNINDPDLKHGIDELFKIIPCKHNINWDVFEHYHMLEYNTDIEKRDGYNIKDADCMNISIKRDEIINKLLESE